MNDLQFLQKNLNSWTLENTKNLDESVHLCIVEDDKAFGTFLKKYLTSIYPYQVLHFEESDKCIDFFQNNTSDQKIHHLIFICDLSLGNGDDGLVLIDRMRSLNIDLFTIAMTGFASIDSAINATKKGVFHYLTKPFALDSIKNLIDSILKEIPKLEDLKENNPRQLEEIFGAKEKLENKKNEALTPFFHSMIGHSACMQELFAKIQKVALSDATVLITGESGTGKELVARALHDLSLRKKNPIVSLNCGAIPHELLESELFGHLKGSFTGAISNRKGRFELANLGSLFLDEIGDMPYTLQVKLLRVLQSKNIEPIGGEKAINIDVRVIAATHRSLEKMVQDKEFREDLFYRLNVIPIHIPSLRERKEDIPFLIDFFIQKFSSADSSNQITFDKESMMAMVDYEWPGNVRELENCLERLIILKGGTEVKPHDLPIKIFRNFQNKIQNDIQESLRAETHSKFSFLSEGSDHDQFELPLDGIDLKKFLSELEDKFIKEALSRTSGNKNAASKLLNLNRTTLIEKMKKKNWGDLQI